MTSSTPIPPRGTALPARSLPLNHPPLAERCCGVLLVNLGTPDGVDYWSMRRYLQQFLSDRRVIEVSRLIWLPLLHLVILSRRPQIKGRDYAKIWNRERDEGPLKTITRAQADKLAEQLLPQSSPRILVDWAMRYGTPTIESRLLALQAQGCDRILLLPLYPQYAAATTATVADDAFDALKTMRWQPALRVAPPWYDDPVYIEALAVSIEKKLALMVQRPEVLLVSFHGMPKDYLLQGDPYYCQCMKTARLLQARLGMDALRYRVVFQSRFGRGEWLSPAADATIQELAQTGVKRIAMVAPGFVADCLETLEEIGVEYRDLFLRSGGEEWTRIDCLNDSAEGMAVIETIARRELQGWVA